MPNRPDAVAKLHSDLDLGTVVDSYMRYILASDVLPPCTPVHQAARASYSVNGKDYSMGVARVGKMEEECQHPKHSRETRGSSADMR